MLDVIRLYGDIEGQYDKLKVFIEDLESKGSYYRENQEILYTGIINRVYSLWETFNKNIVYNYFLRNKSSLIEAGDLVIKLRLNELPGYIVEKGIYNYSDDVVQYSMKQELITYTSKNIDISQMKDLYDRVGVMLPMKLYDSKTLFTFLSSCPMTFDVTDDKINDLTNAIKKIIRERNKISHYTDIDDYYQLSDIKNWILFFKVLCKEISKYICQLISQEQKTNFNSIGEFVAYYKKKKVLAININETIVIDKSSLIGLFKNGRLVDVLRPISFMVNNITTEVVEGGNQAGIIFESLFCEDSSITETNGIVLL